MKKRVRIAIIIFAEAISILVGCLAVSSVLIASEAHIKPDYPKIDISDILTHKQLSKTDYEILFYQTGLGKPAIDEIIMNFSDSAQQIIKFQENFFSNINYICKKNTLISMEEYLVDNKGNKISGTNLASVHNGDIFITKSSYIYGWRNGHAALVVDAAKKLTLESVVLGTDSCLQNVKKWTFYPNFMQLRLKNGSPQLVDKIAQSALTNLDAVPYGLTVGILNSKFSKPGEVKRTHCSHLVWQAFRFFDYDLDSDGGMIVTPKDIANSPYLEVVQIFGVNPKNIWP